MRTACFACAPTSRELVGTRNATRAALLPTDELQAQVIAHVDGLAARGAPRLRIEGERLAIKHDASGGHTASAQEMLAWLHGADMKTHLFDMIEKQRERELRHGALVMSTQERKSRIALLDGQILDKEREEEQVIRDAEERHDHPSPRDLRPARHSRSADRASREGRSRAGAGSRGLGLRHSRQRHCGQQSAVASFSSLVGDGLLRALANVRAAAGRARAGS
jgi:hypothetical protein